MTEVILRIINSNGEPVTGLTASNIKFRKSPYGSGNEITGLTVTESGTQGNYKITGFSSWQKAKLYINVIFQEWWGEQFTGDPANNFVDFSSAQQVSGQKTFTGANTHSGNNTFSGNNTHSGNNTFGGNNTFTGAAEFDNSVVFVNGQQAAMLGDTYLRNPLIVDPSGTPAGSSLIWKDYAGRNFVPIGANKIIVDSKAAADIEGKVYRSIGNAVNYAYNNGSPGALNRWEILVLPHHTGVYTEAFYWYDFIDITGIGWVKIQNVPSKSLFIRAGSMTDRNVKASNLHFESTNYNLNFQKMIADNCSMIMIEDDYAPVLTIEDSQFRTYYFGFIGAVNFVNAGSNRVINCSGGTDVHWNTDDKVYNYSFISGDYIQQ